jgi:dihydroflavonol-4-reductase
MLNLSRHSQVLVTGSNGFIGGHLVESLLGRSCSVRCLVRKTSDLTRLKELDVTRVEADLSDAKSLLRAVEGVDWIFHLAGKTKASSREEFFQANAAGTENLLNAAARGNSGLKRFVYVSSLAAAGPSRGGRPVTESDEPRPVTWYGESKLEGERITLRFGDRIPVTLVRPPPVFGPWDEDMLKLFQAVSRGVIPFIGKRSSSAAFLYVEDLVAGLIQAAETPSASGRTYFLANVSCMEWIEFGRIAARAMGVRALPVRVPFWMLAAGVRLRHAVMPESQKPSILNPQKLPEYRESRWCCDPARAEAELGFRPRYGIPEAVAKTVGWYRSRGLL